MSNSRNISRHNCIDTIAPKSDWLVWIGHKFINLNYLRNEDVWNRNINEYRHLVCAHDGDCKIIFPAPEPIEKSLYDIVEEDPLRSFNYIQKQCVKSRILIPRLAIFLSGRAIEQIWSRIFTKQNVDEEFVQLFYEFFFTMFLKRPYTWFSLHLLIKASKAYPVYFRLTITALLKDVNITSTVVQDYVEHLNAHDSTVLMKFITEIPFREEEFNHILPVLYALYKKSHITEAIFQFINTNLETYSSYCAYNLTYGRLLLYFVQNVSGHDVMLGGVRTMVDRHRTPYKTLCIDTLDQYVNDLVVLQNQFFEGPRIVIPRPTDDIRL